MSGSFTAVAIGSNLGDRRGYLGFARERISALPNTWLVAQTIIEETPPLGGLRQPTYLNQMVLVRTHLAPATLLSHLQEVEAEAGRTPRELRWASRTLDCDIVLYGDEQIDTSDLVLPHPGLSDRSFWHRELRELGVVWHERGGWTWPTMEHDQAEPAHAGQGYPR